MHTTLIFATPQWANILLALPLVAYFIFRRYPLRLTKFQLIISALFGIAFGFVEALANLYIHLRISQTASFSPGLFLQANSLAHLPPHMLFLESFRQAGLVLMMLCLAMLAARTWTARLGLFLWSYAIAFAAYYASLYAIIGWPNSLLDNDILSWIAKPVYGQVWFPVLISLLLIIIVPLSKKSSRD